MRVASFTARLLLSTLETVATETSACLAISLMDSLLLLIKSPSKIILFYVPIFISYFIHLKIAT
jgi:hypothetical protein